jgi:hypothetical protein
MGLDVADFNIVQHNEDIEVGHFIELFLNKKKYSPALSF